MLRNLPVLGPPLKRLAIYLNVIRGGQRRSEALLRLSRPQGLFQPFAFTFADRYPQFFAAVCEAIGDGPDRHILSFGCSTGQEAYALRQYFPAALLIGIDINPYNIAKARERADARMRFEVGAAAPKVETPFDAIFAMAVFRHGDLGEAPPRCDHLIRFADFERMIGELTAVLRPGGLFSIACANFRFADTATAAGFERIFAVEWPGERQTPIYGRDDRLLPGIRGDDGIWRKTPPMV